MLPEFLSLLQLGTDEARKLGAQPRAAFHAGSPGQDTEKDQKKMGKVAPV